MEKTDDGRPPRRYYAVAGHPDDTLIFDPGIVQCGEITDGVALEHASELSRPRGGWVISYAALQDMYERATEVRHGGPGEKVTGSGR